MRALERFLLLQIIDQRWREHLYDMDYLREGIHLRGFAQIDPLVAYKNEGFALFQDLMNSIWSDFARMVYNVEVEVEATERRRRAARAARRRRGGALNYSGGTLEDQPSAYGEAAASEDARRAPAARWSSSAASTSTSSSAATTRAGAGRARSTRSATVHRPGDEWPSDAPARQPSALMRATSSAEHALGVRRCRPGRCRPPRGRRRRSSSISAPTSVVLERSMIDLPTANTVFCCCRPQSTWIEMLHSGNSA